MYNINNQTFLIILVTYFILHIIEKKIKDNFHRRKCKVLKLIRYIFLSISSF